MVSVREMKWTTLVWTHPYEVNYVRHSSSCSTFWYRFFEELGIYWESIQEIIETVVSSDSEADHWSNWNYWNYNDGLAASHVERRPCWLTELMESKIKWFMETRFSRFGSDWRGTGGIRVRIFPGFTALVISDEIHQKTMITELKCEHWAHQRKDHLHVNEKWHWSAKTRKQRTLYGECSQNYWVCSKIHAMTLVISRAWIGEETVRNSCQQTWWTMGQNCWGHDAQLCRKRTSLYSVLPAH